jgi:hypothetical protein
MGSEDQLRAHRLLEFAWSVYEGYELASREDGAGRYFKASENASIAHRYTPLIDTPHLFLEFARLEEQKDKDQAMPEWIGRRGLLGMHRTEPRAFLEHSYSERGGLGETVEVFREETRRANKLLSLYEAVLSRDTEKLEQAIGISGGSRGAQRAREYHQAGATAAGVSYVDALIEHAMRHVVYEVQEIIETLVVPCFGSLAPSDQEAPGRWWLPELLTRSWCPANLLGAMYLQFYWLITSSGELSRCKYCGRVISYAPPIPRSGKARKPRSDKEFCDSRCRQNYHYNNRIKPRRQSEIR